MSKEPPVPHLKNVTVAPFPYVAKPEKLAEVRNNAFVVPRVASSKINRKYLANGGQDFKYIIYTLFINIG
jgi:hypothetical protein